MSAAFDLVCRILRRALEAEEGVEGDPVALGSVAPGDLLDVVRRHRVPQVLLGQSAALGLPADVVDTLEAMLRANRERQLLHVLETVRAWQLVDAAGIEALVVKGIPLAVLTTGSPDGRGAGDVDLLVRPADAARAHGVLTAAGWRLHEAGRIEPGMWAWRHVLRWGRTLTYLGPGADVDLHWRLDTIPGAVPGPDELMARRVRVPVGGVEIPTIGAADAFNHLAMHREGWTWLRTLVDLRRLARDPQVFDQHLAGPALTSLAVARGTVGLPAGVPARVSSALDRVPDRALAQVRDQHLRPPSIFGGATTGRDLRHGLASARRPQDVTQLAMGVLLPAHTALEVRSDSTWAGLPKALGLRARHLARRRG